VKEEEKELILLRKNMGNERVDQKVQSPNLLLKKRPLEKRFSLS
jgi:hypothetical protein